MSDDQHSRGPQRIYLEPPPYSPEGRLWCEDDVWPLTPEHDGKGIEYVRADLHDQLRRAAEMGMAALDRLMGDSDLPEDDSYEMRSCQALSAALATPERSEDDPAPKVHASHDMARDGATYHCLRCGVRPYHSTVSDPCPAGPGRSEEGEA